MATKIDFSIKIIYTLFVGCLIPVYWKQYGPVNFLWFSDISMLLLVPALWLESRVLFSAAALSVVLFELVWNIDFFVRLFSGRNLIGLSSYMFDPTISLTVRALSLFHVWLPPLIIWYVYRLGYDSRGLALQIPFAWVVLLASYLFVKPSDNVNWVYGFGEKPQSRLPSLMFLFLLMLGFAVLVYLPSHLVLKKLFGD
jgi:hypothetical protein